MCSDEAGDRGNQSRSWHAGGLLGGQQVDPMAEEGLGLHESRGLKLLLQRAVGASRTCLPQNDLVSGDEGQSVRTEYQAWDSSS